MAILPTTQNTVARYAAGLYGVKLGNGTNNAVMADVGLSSANGVNGLNAVLNNYFAPFTLKTSAEVAAIVVANAGIVAGQFGLTAANVADAVTIVTAQINAAAPLGNQGVAIANVLASWSNDYPANPVYGAAATAWNAKIAAATAYATTAGTQDVGIGDVVTNFNLTTGNDTVMGSGGDDVIAGIYGTLNSGDKIDGGAGNDMLKAQVAGVVSANISNVEHLQFQAQFRTGNDSGDNNVADEQTIVKVDFNTNVTNVKGFNTIENNNSRADLIIEDVRIANNQITKDITVIMRETDPGNVDYGVYFDQNSLRNVSTSASQINLRVLDTNNTNLGLAPLKDSPYGSFTFSYSVNGSPATSVTLASQAIQDAQTFPEMVVALRAAVDAIFGAGTVTVTEGVAYNVIDSVSGNSVQGKELVLAAPGNIAFTTPPGSGWTATDVVPAISGLYTSFNVGTASSSELVTVKVILDDVGRGSTGGDLVIGGLSVGETSTSKGVQKFMVEVQDNSKLQTIESTNNALREVVIVNGLTDRVDNAYNENQVNSGSLTVRGFEEPNNGTLTTGNNALPGSKAAGIVGGQNAYGFSDVKIIDASAMTGKFDFDAEVTQASIAKYLNLKDGAPAQPATDNQAFVYTGGSNNDTMSVVLDTSVVGARNQLTGREDFSFAINGGAGNDEITVQIAGPNTANWYANHKAMKNLTVDAGDGNDTVTLTGTGSARVMAGSGDDTVYLDNSGSKGAKWVVNESGLNTDPLAGVVPTAFLVNGKLTVSFAGGTAAGGGVTAVPPAGITGADAVAAAYQNGFEVVVDIPTGANYAVSQFHINQAIKKAINEDGVLSKLLVAEDGPASTLNITSLIDGTFVANDLEFVVSSTLGATVAADVLAAYKAFTSNSAATAANVLATNTATVATANSVSGVGVDRGALAQSGGSTLTDAVTITTEGSAGTGPTAGVFEQSTLTVAALALGETLVVDGLTLTANAAGVTVGDVQAALIGAGPASITTTGVLTTYTAANVGGTTVFTNTVFGNVTNLANTGTGGGAIVETVPGALPVAGTPAATEVVNIAFAGTPVTGETFTFTFPGSASTVSYVAVAGDDAADIATGLAAAVTAAIGAAPWNAYATAVAVGDKLTLTGVANTVIANPTNASIVSTGGGATFSNGSISTAESDNFVNLGAGNDVAVLGTGANSNDTVVFTGYNLGKNTIVNFEDAAGSTGSDLLDFKSYLNGKASASGSADSAKAIAITLAAPGDVVTDANSVTVANGTFTAVDTFAGLTAAKLLAAVNSTNTGTSDYAGITAASLDASTTYTTAAGANNLVGGVGKAVYLVQNNLNEGEYHVFELSFNGLAANTNKDFTAAELIGTVDFGNSVTFAQNLLA